MLVWVFKIIIIGATTILYRLGGAKGYSKIYRRLGCPVFYFGGIVFISLLVGKGFNPLVLLSIPLCYGALSLGYTNLGGWGFVKRFIAGSAIGCSSLPVSFAYNGWQIYWVHLPLCIFSMCYFGLINPFKREEEEAIMAMISFLLPIMMV